MKRLSKYGALPICFSMDISEDVLFSVLLAVDGSDTDIRLITKTSHAQKARIDRVMKDWRDFQEIHLNLTDKDFLSNVTGKIPIRIQNP